MAEKQQVEDGIVLLLGSSNGWERKGKSVNYNLGCFEQEEENTGTKVGIFPKILLNLIVKLAEEQWLGHGSAC